MRGYIVFAGMLVAGLSITPRIQAGESVASEAVIAPSVLKADADGDGKLSLEEFQAARLALITQQFQALDTNHDGYIDADERLQAVSQLKTQLQQAMQTEQLMPGGVVTAPVSP